MARPAFNPIRNSSVKDLPSYRKFNDELMGTDLMEKAFDGQWASNDDYAVIAGLGNLRQAIYHRLITNPGELFAHPDYGCGLEEYVSAPIDLTTKAELTKRIKEQLTRDPRVAKVSYVRLTTGDSTTPIGTLIINIGIVPIGNTAEQELHFAISERDWLVQGPKNYDSTYFDMRPKPYPYKA